MNHAKLKAQFIIANFRGKTVKTCTTNGDDWLDIFFTDGTMLSVPADIGWDLEPEPEKICGQLLSNGFAGICQEPATVRNADTSWTCEDHKR